MIEEQALGTNPGLRGRVERQTAAEATADRRLAAIDQCLAGAALATQPFPHFIVEGLLDPATLEALLGWFETGAVWSVQNSSFYSQHGCSNLNEILPSSSRAILGAEDLLAIQAHLERLFSVKLTDRVYIAAHKLLPGQGIGIHTDRPYRGSETHRFLLHVNRAFEDSYGGHLLFFTRNDPGAIAQIVRPVTNSAVGFALSESSFHAVNDVSDGVRYSLVFSYWTAGAEIELDASPPRGGADDGTPEIRGRYAAPLLELLRSLGADRVPHSQRTLLDHLIGCAAILERWGCVEDICKAGLFHSVYGTEGFRTALLSLDDRGALRARIGERAERLSYLFSAVDRRSLHEALPLPAPYRARVRGSGEELALGRDEVQDLLLVMWANALEQAFTLPVTQEELTSMRDELALTKDLLPDGVRDVLARELGASS
ncbi:cyclophane-containing peptide 2OG-Fe(II) oxygenase YhhC [Sorangium sp. So ce1099]|uniref:cyclophane-containing peptide 2OG-Fe(II) oxygenase YhhC n=1 Tax=Sorangium sp. So ce1099 TaxID=3133331 RepID=UPI003F618061